MAFLVVPLLAAGCGSGGSQPPPASADLSLSAPDLWNGDAAAASLLAEIAGVWHGKIQPNYAAGCLCLRLDDAGVIQDPSGITLNFPVTSTGDRDVEVVDPVAGKLIIHTLTLGTPWDILDATYDPAAKTITGQWMGMPASFDGPIWLDRDPKTCKQRTGLDGAPC